jgi:2-polyprenyl-6-methoxyphenol hydroxylase-like FAD-dependent oxidoreductase
VKVACVGAGPAGVYLSVLLKLRDPGHDVTIYERRQSSSVTGWGVTLGEIFMAHLSEQDRESADRILEAALFWEDEVVHIRGTQVSVPMGACYNVSRRRMLDVLSDRAQELGVRIEYGREIRSLSELPDADLIVAADGVSSQLRDEAGDFGTQDTWGRNKYMWLGMDKSFEVVHVFFVPTPSGWIWAHAFGIDPETGTFVVECAPETWSGLGFDALSTDEALPVLEELFSEHLAGCRLLADPGDGTKARWLNFRTVSNQHWYSGNVVLVGDSAHTTHFAVGMGTLLALEDVIVLADSLHQHANLEAALQAYETRRQAELLPVLTEAHFNARWFENVSRYIDLRPRQFEKLFHGRRSPIIAVLPPRLSYLLLQAASRVSLVDVIRARAAAAVSAISGRRYLARRVGAQRKESSSADAQLVCKDRRADVLARRPFTSATPTATARTSRPDSRAG